MSLVTKAGWRHFALIVLLASVVRGGTLLATHPSLTADPDGYREIARGLALHGVFGLEAVDPSTGNPKAFPTAFRPPLYPWVLSWLADPQGHPTNAAIAILHGLLGTVTVAGTYLIARRLLDKPPTDADAATDGSSALNVPRRVQNASIFAAGLVAIDPLLLMSSSQVMTETLAAALVVLAVGCWLPLTQTLQPDQARPLLTLIRHAGLLGLALGLAYLCRPTFILWPLGLSAYLGGLAVHRRSARPTIAAATMLLVVAGFVAAWSARNHRHFGKPIWATTHGGYTLLLGNNPSFYEYLQTPGMLGRPWDPSSFFASWARRSEADPRDPAFWEQQPDREREPAVSLPPPEPGAGGELADDRLAYQTAVATIRRDPVSFLHACLWRLGRLHSPLPLRTQQRGSLGLIAVTTFYSVVLILILTGIWKLSWRLGTLPWVAPIALWVALASVHTVYWTDMRMRAPAVPVLSILAAAAWLPRSPGATGQPRRRSVLQSTDPTSAS